MTGESLEKILNLTGYQVAENCFESEQKLPYIAYLEKSSINLFADDSRYKTATAWQVELYARKKDRNAEKILEHVLDNAGICWDKNRVYNREERYVQIVYEFEEWSGEDGSSNT